MSMGPRDRGEELGHQAANGCAGIIMALGVMMMVLLVVLAFIAGVWIVARTIEALF